jgi:hypothetical protein
MVIELGIAMIISFAATRVIVPLPSAYLSPSSPPRSAMPVRNIRQGTVATITMPLHLLPPGIAPLQVLVRDLAGQEHLRRAGPEPHALRPPRPSLDGQPMPRSVRGALSLPSIRQVHRAPPSKEKTPEKTLTAA